MTAAEKAMGVVKNVLIFRETLERINKEMAELRGDIKALSGNVIDIDKRLVRIETMIEMSARNAGQPRIEG
ncbi:hypothetical protein [Sphingomonas sp. HMP6]|uniref:hypothetical protein n=1 Tax=Sphingomonas sp. HMP6 TaxID=1517551 RepID=UPI0015967B7D|nr:hypothetical protein [Sphingomonas sp. HMP6]BCA59501.1 hypothetical protein HMP06_2270 [Sphingomonas sp. HMP6]